MVKAATVAIKSPPLLRAIAVGIRTIVATLGKTMAASGTPTISSRQATANGTRAPAMHEKAVKTGNPRKKSENRHCLFIA